MILNFWKLINLNALVQLLWRFPENIEIVAALLEIKANNIIARATNLRHARVLRQIGVDTIVSTWIWSRKKNCFNCS
ncbi:NAD-binding protein [Mycoplasmopsis cynos]|uniref:NAD-binding protein n=1 Tax=Mycoplasmopsis cynos TaxID=171284 RepID=UPI003A5C7C60